MRFLCAVVLIIGMALPAIAQEERGWSFAGSFNGSSNSDGVQSRACARLRVQQTREHLYRRPVLRREPEIDGDLGHQRCDERTRQRISGLPGWNPE